MGVPAFFRWLTRKYPSVIVHCLEEKARDFDGVEQNVDTSQPNPNGVEFDNLYLDMNGIIHPCTHPEDKPAPKNEDEMMIAIFECIDRLFRIVRPRKILYMAIDGVAPRAKMNQQRSRRFRASKETAEKIIEITRIREELAAKGANLPPEKEKGEHFDSNCITPGTPFMARLSACLHYYIHARMNEDPGWKNIKVILSDANVPGEGEHKIMDFIRRQRAQPDHDPNTQHCLCGADADLIMLGLATHEPNFTIIREEFLPFKPRPCEICGQIGHEMKECEGLESNQVTEPPPIGAGQNFIFVRLNVLREYLEKELSMPNLPFEYDFERLVDDWVFMCFFVGNDFLPHLPSLEIREDAIDRLVSLYKKTVYRTGGYLTDSGTVNLDRVQLIMSDLGDMEDEIFKKRQEREVSFRLRDKQKKQRMKRMKEFKPNWVPRGQFEPQPLGPGRQVASIMNPRQEAYNMRVAGMNAEKAVSSGAGAQSGPTQQSEQNSLKRKLDESDEDDEPADEVRLWESGFKDRYYESKFDVGSENKAFRHRVGHEYVRGLCWVLQYYYQGCSSWKWYYPYHYAPFASDFINVADVESKFEKDTQPFKPLEQLMGVFPAASSGHVPPPWATLMSDPNSSIIDFYPEDFKIDLNGKKFAWQGVALLPFVDENRLRKALEPLYKDLTPAEIARNIRGSDRLYIGGDHPKYTALRAVSIQKETDDEFLIDGVRGAVGRSQTCVKVNASIESPVFGLPVIHCNATVCVEFHDPVYPDDYIFLAHRLKGAVEPPRVLKPGDESRSQGWRPVIGMVPSTQRAFVTGAGHRMLNHTVNKSDGYNAVPPPRMGGSSDRNQPGRYVRPPGWQDRGKNQHGQSNQYNRDRNYQQPRQGGYGNSSASSFPKNGGGYQNARAGYHTSSRGDGNRGHEAGGGYKSGGSGYQANKGSYQSATRTSYNTVDTGYQPASTGYQSGGSNYQSGGSGYQSGGSGYQSGGSGYQSGGSGYQSGGSGYQTGGSGYQSGGSGYQSGNQTGRSSYQSGRQGGYGNSGRGYQTSDGYGSHSSGSSDRRDRGSQQGSYSRPPQRR